MRPGTQEPVNLGVDFLGPFIAPNGKDSAVSGGQAHGHDFVGRQLSAQGLPGRCGCLATRWPVPRVGGGKSGGSATGPLGQRLF